MKYSGRVFRTDEFEFIDFDIGVLPGIALGKLQGQSKEIKIVLHPDAAKAMVGIWAELVSEVNRGETEHVKTDEDES